MGIYRKLVLKIHEAAKRLWDRQEVAKEALGWTVQIRERCKLRLSKKLCKTAWVSIRT